MKPSRAASGRHTEEASCVLASFVKTNPLVPGQNLGKMRGEKNMRNRALDNSYFS